MITGNCKDITYLQEVAREIIDYDKQRSNVLESMSLIKRGDEYTYVHSVNVAFYSMLIAKWIGLSKDEITKATMSGLLHDIGKVKISDQILNKPGKLTQDEYDIVKQHTVYGFEIASNLNELDNEIKNAILLHHERMDGSGYPFQYNCDRLNIYARIVSIADVFDAMTSDRVYKKKNTPFEAFQMFEREGVRIFDIKIMDTFRSYIANYLTGINVLLSNGESGDIVFVPLNNITNPIVRVMNEYRDLSSENTIKILELI